MINTTEIVSLINSELGKAFPNASSIKLEHIAYKHSVPTKVDSFEIKVLIDGRFRAGFGSSPLLAITDVIKAVLAAPVSSEEQIIPLTS